MKRIRLISSFAAVILAASLLTSCSESLKSMKSDNGVFNCDGITYRMAPLGYEPTVIGEEYAKTDSKLKEKLYKIGSASPEEWLTTEYSGLSTFVYYNEKIDLPSLSDMKPSLCYICEQTEKVASNYTIGDKTHKGDESAVINNLVSEITNPDTEEELWDTKDFLEVYQLKFFSEDWETIYYNVSYGVASDGFYLYDRAAKRCVKTGINLSYYYEGSLENDENSIG